MKTYNYDNENLVAKSYLDIDSIISDNNDFFKFDLKNTSSIDKPLINYKGEKFKDQNINLIFNESSNNSKNSSKNNKSFSFLNMDIKIKSNLHKIDTFKDLFETSHRLSNNCKDSDTLNLLIHRYKPLQNDDNSKLNIELTSDKCDYGKLTIYPESEVLDKNKTNKTNFESQMLIEILERLSDEDEVVASLFNLKKNNKFNSNFKHFVISNNEYLMKLTAQMNTRYMELSKNNNNLKPIITDSFAINVDIKSFNDTTLFYFMFFIGCYIQDLSLDISKNLFDSKMLKNKRQDYDDICLMSKENQKFEIFQFFKMFSEPENMELLQIIQKNLDIIFDLVSDIITGLKCITSLFKDNNVSFILI